MATVPLTLVIIVGGVNMLEAFLQILPIALAAIIVLSASIYGFLKFERKWMKIALWAVIVIMVVFLFVLEIYVIAMR